MLLKALVHSICPHPSNIRSRMSSLQLGYHYISCYDWLNIQVFEKDLLFCMFPSKMFWPIAPLNSDFIYYDITSYSFFRITRWYGRTFTFVEPWIVKTYCREKIKEDKYVSILSDYTSEVQIMHFDWIILILPFCRFLYISTWAEIFVHTMFLGRLTDVWYPYTIDPRFAQQIKLPYRKNKQNPLKKWVSVKIRRPTCLYKNIKNIKK